MKANRLMKFLQRYSAKKPDLNLSVELPDNHFYNKKVQDGRKTTLEMKGPRRRRISKKISRKDSILKVALVQQNMSDIQVPRKHEYKREQISSLPSTLKIMPMIPFWRTSFDIIENQYEVLVTTTKEEKNDNQLSEADYITMRRKREENEPIYI